ncbi:MAG: type II secretion system F family protein [Anaerovoracaceae bacterium]
MCRNYGIWDFSLPDLILVLSASLAAGTATGWLFYDRLEIGLWLSGALFLMAKPRYIRWQLQRRQRILLLQFRDVLYSISSAVSVGRSMEQALEESMEFWKGTYDENDLIMRELAAMVRQMKEGNERDLDVLKDFSRRSGLQDISDFVMVYENCRASGADLVKAIDRATGIIGDRIDLERELHTLMAQKQFEGRIILLSPFVLLLFLKISSPGFLDPLTASSAGRMLSTAALGLIAVSALWMERVNRVDF